MICTIFSACSSTRIGADNNTQPTTTDTTNSSDKSDVDFSDHTSAMNTSIASDTSATNTSIASASSPTNTGIESNTSPTNTGIENATINKKTEDAETDYINEDNKPQSNTFFFKDNITEATYSGTFAFGEDVQTLDVKLSVEQVALLKDGAVYELELEPVDGVGEERLNLGYFYVQKNTIYRFDASHENLESLKSSYKLPEDSVIVCQAKELKDKLGEDESGFHYYIEVDGNKRVYHSYNDMTGTGYFESFTWEKNKGLVNYRSGFGAENDLIELQIK